jgi:hypothetical protein
MKLTADIIAFRVTTEKLLCVSLTTFRAAAAQHADMAPLSACFGQQHSVIAIARKPLYIAN